MQPRSVLRIFVQHDCENGDAQNIDAIEEDGPSQQKEQGFLPAFSKSNHKGQKQNNNTRGAGPYPTKLCLC